MVILKKILTKLYGIYFKSYRECYLDSQTMIDYRCEIECKCNIQIGRKTVLYKYVTIYKKKEGLLRIGESSHIAPYGYFLMGKQNITIGDNVAIAKNCSFFCVTNTIPTDSQILFKDSYETGDIIIGNNVFIGTNCIVLPNTTIANDVVVAANSTVKGHLESGYLYGGNPVTKIKKVYNS